MGDGSLEAAYRELGLSSGATDSHVKQAYRRLVMQCHPDLHQTGSKEFLRITAAYERIIDRNSSDNPTATRGPVMYRMYPVRKNFGGREASVWGFGLAAGCLVFGSVLLWARAQIYQNNYSTWKGARQLEPTSDAKKRERIACVLLQKRGTEGDDKAS